MYLTDGALDDAMIQCAKGDCLYGLWGQSNAVGQADYSGQFVFPSLPIVGAEDPAQSYETSYGGAQLAYNINHGGFVSGFGNAAPYDVAGNPNMGPELSMVRLLGTYAPKPAAVAKYAVNGSSLASDWIAGANYATAAIAYMQARQIDLGGIRIGAILWDQGEADALNSTDANNYQANLTTLVGMIRNVLGPVPFIFKRLSVNCIRTFTSTVRSQQAAYAAADANSVMIDTDDTTLQTDGLHYDTRSQQLIGDRFALAALRKRNEIAVPQPSTTFPYFVGADAQRIKTSAAPDVHWWGGTLPGDVGILAVVGTKTNVANSALAVSGGFTLIGSAPRAVSGGDSVWVTFYWCRADQTTMDANSGHMPTVTLANSNTNNWAKIYVFRNCIASGVPYDVVATSQATAYATACSIPGAVTTRTNQLVAAFSFGTVASAGANKLGSMANAGLASFAAQNIADEDTGTTSTAQGWVVAALATGQLASSGSFGATTGTYPITTLQSNVCLALLGTSSSAAPDISTVTKDATSNWLRPATSAEVATLMSAAGIASSGGFFAGYNCQEASGNLADFSGNGFTLTAANAPSYANVDSGWSAKSVGAADNSTSNFNNSAAGLADPATTSYIMILMASFLTAPAAARSLGRIASGTSLEPRINATPVTSLLSGATSTNGLKNPTTFGFQPVILQHNKTGSIQALMTAQEIIVSSTYHDLATKNIQLFRTATNAAGAHINQALFGSGAACEITPSQARKLQTLMMAGQEPLWM